MKKIALTVTALAFTASTHAATLDVHGDIKINGTTVITNKGVVVSAGSINLSKYLKSGNGVVILEGVEQKGDQKVNWKYEFTADETHFLEDKETRDGVLSWHGKWSDFKDMGNTLTTHYKGDDGTECTVTNVQTFNVSTGVSYANIGEMVSRIDSYERVSTYSCGRDENTSSGIEITEMTPYKLTSWSNGDFSYDDCLVYSHNMPNNKQLRTSCVGVGVVEISHLGDWGSVTKTLKLTRFTPAG